MISACCVRTIGGEDAGKYQLCMYLIEQEMLGKHFKKLSKKQKTRVKEHTVVIYYEMFTMGVTSTKGCLLSWIM